MAELDHIVTGLSSDIKPISVDEAARAFFDQEVAKTEGDKPPAKESKSDSKPAYKSRDGKPAAKPAPEVAAPEPEQPSESEEAKASSEDSSEGESEEARESEPKSGISSLKELAEHLDVDEADLYGLHVPYTASGERQEFTLSEVKDIVSQHATLKAEREALAQQRAEVEKTSAAKMQELQEQFTAAEDMLKLARSRLDVEANAEELRELRKNDPAEWTARNAELQAKREEIDKATRELAEQRKRGQAQQLEEFNAQRAKAIEQERQRMVELVPEWKDREKWQAEDHKIANYLHTRGFSPEEIQGLYDSRSIAVARDAMLYRESLAKSQASTKKVQKAPLKVTKPGARQGKEAVDKARFDKSLEKLRKGGGKLDDAAAVILNAGLV